jgi:hypothetical protein
MLQADVDTIKDDEQHEKSGAVKQQRSLRIVDKKIDYDGPINGIHDTPSSKQCITNQLATHSPAG